MSLVEEADMPPTVVAVSSFAASRAGALAVLGEWEKIREKIVALNVRLKKAGRAEIALHSSRTAEPAGFRGNVDED